MKDKSNRHDWKLVPSRVSNYPIWECSKCGYKSGTDEWQKKPPDNLKMAVWVSDGDVAILRCNEITLHKIMNT